MTRHCDHAQGIAVEANVYTCDDGARRVSLQLRCVECQRLVIFKGIAENGSADEPSVSQGGRHLSLPFAFGGSYLGG